MYQGFLTKKKNTYPGWEKANEIESQIAERLIKRIEQTVIGNIKLSGN